MAEQSWAEFLASTPVLPLKALAELASTAPDAAFEAGWQALLDTSLLTDMRSEINLFAQFVKCVGAERAEARIVAEWPRLDVEVQSRVASAAHDPAGLSVQCSHALLLHPATATPVRIALLGGIALMAFRAGRSEALRSALQAIRDSGLETAFPDLRHSAARYWAEITTTSTDPPAKRLTWPGQAPSSPVT